MECSIFKEVNNYLKDYSELYNFFNQYKDRILFKDKREIKEKDFLVEAYFSYKENNIILPNEFCNVKKSMIFKYKYYYSLYAFIHELIHAYDYNKLNIFDPKVGELKAVALALVIINNTYISKKVIKQTYNINPLNYVYINALNYLIIGFNSSYNNIKEIFRSINRSTLDDKLNNTKDILYNYLLSKIDTIVIYDIKLHNYERLHEDISKIIKELVENDYNPKDYSSLDRILNKILEYLRAFYRNEAFILIDKIFRYINSYYIGARLGYFLLKISKNQRRYYFYEILNIRSLNELIDIVKEIEINYGFNGKIYISIFADDRRLKELKRKYEKFSLKFGEKFMKGT
ncbi:hypothetical protein MJ1_0315 [Nanobdella aerobiophila]|uniref:Uncharacterized protein n=1 Tax=Nanobdella aerobiophila TaxID=2586965 RepID=A0A915SI92_9ARCH|nr:hypothetical protein [Nanobdella aerobiophila]BBL45482.1 hypothetical protein MJ1_0315 [Nanobdella aerobiophila]